ncbi:MAG: hypothetical protein KJ063_14320 [Anaerolineae bacterium]|nr:hypothetical protein [Anaerolineae bacterium]
MYHDQPLRWFREAGVLLLTVSLLLLPWLHYDRIRNPDVIVIVMGREFVLNPLGNIAGSLPPVFIGFFCFWLAYAFARLLPDHRTILTLYPFFAACIIYMAVYSRYILFALASLGRMPDIFNIGFAAPCGLNLSCLGALLLLAGILFTQTNPSPFYTATLFALGSWVAATFLINISSIPIPREAHISLHLLFIFAGLTLALRPRLNLLREPPNNL